MMDFEKELEQIIANDPLGLLDIKPKASARVNAAAMVAIREISACISKPFRRPAAFRTGHLHPQETLR